MRGETVTTRISRRPGSDRAAIDADGWLHTGDLGTLDADGYLRIVGRIKDMFIVGGFRPQPAEIENLMSPTRRAGCRDRRPPTTAWRSTKRWWYSSRLHQSTGRGVGEGHGMRPKIANSFPQLLDGLPVDEPPSHEGRSASASSVVDPSNGVPGGPSPHSRQGMSSRQESTTGKRPVCASSFFQRRTPVHIPSSTMAEQKLAFDVAGCGHGRRPLPSPFLRPPGPAGDAVVPISMGSVEPSRWR